MEKFERKSIKKADIPNSDQGVKVSELLSIVQNNELSNKLLELLNVDAIQDEFIKIKGAKKLIDTQKAINNRYQKEDLKSKISDISLYNQNEFSINFNNTENNEYFKSLNLVQVSTIPIYSATREFFSELYQMDRYASSLIADGQKGILETNLEMLKKVCENSKRYRILHDNDENLFYLRGIISLDKYYNYDNNLAVLIALLTLHNETKRTGIEYSMKLCEYNESFIRIFFESSEIMQLETIGKVKNIIEVSNDEIRREALRFTGVCSIIFENNENPNNELYINPKEIKSRILSIGHNRKPKTAIDELVNIDNTRTVHANLFVDIQKIIKIKNPEEIKFLVRAKVEKAKTSEVKKLKSKLLNELDKTASNLIQLLTIFSKIELLAAEDIDAIEYLRFIIYQALIEKK